MYSDGTSALKTEYYTHDNRTNNRGNRQTKSVKRSVPRKSTKLIKKPACRRNPHRFPRRT